MDCMKGLFTIFLAEFSITGAANIVNYFLYYFFIFFL